MPGAVLYREGSRRAPDHRVGGGRRRRPGLAIRFAGIASREAADTLREAYLETAVRPEAGPGPRRGTTGTRSIGVTVRGLDGAELGDVQRHLPRRRERGVRRRWRRRTGRSTCPRSGRSSGSSPRAAARSSSTPKSLDLRPPRERRRTQIGRAPRDGRARKRKPAAADPAESPAPDPEVAATRRRAMTLEIDVLTLFPAMIDGPLALSIPGRIQEQGLADDPRPRPARLRPGPASLRGRRPIRRRRGHGDARRSRSSRRSNAVRRPESTVILLDPAARSSARRAPSTSPARASRPRLPALRGRRRAHPRVRRPRALDRRLRPLRRRAAGPRRHRRRHPAAAGRHRRRVDGRGVVQRRVAGVPAVHAPAVVPRHGRARRS